jgi:hypothetical protein
MSDQNISIQYAFQNQKDAAILKCASILVGMDRPDLAKNILDSSRIDAARIRQMQMRSTVFITVDQNTVKKTGRSL